MFLDYDNFLFYNHHSDDICLSSSATNPISYPDPGVTSYTVEILGSYIVQCGGIKNSVLSNKCFLGDFESSNFMWQEFQLGVAMNLPYLVAVDSKVCHIP